MIYLDPTGPTSAGKNTSCVVLASISLHQFETSGNPRQLRWNLQPDDCTRAAAWYVAELDTTFGSPRPALWVQVDVDSDTACPVLWRSFLRQLAEFVQIARFEGVEFVCHSPRFLPRIQTAVGWFHQHSRCTQLAVALHLLELFFEVTDRSRRAAPPFRTFLSSHPYVHVHALGFGLENSGSILTSLQRDSYPLGSRLTVVLLGEDVAAAPGIVQEIWETCADPKPELGLWDVSFPHRYREWQKWLPTEPGCGGNQETDWVDVRENLDRGPDIQHPPQLTIDIPEPPHLDTTPKAPGAPRGGRVAGGEFPQNTPKRWSPGNWCCLGTVAVAVCLSCRKLLNRKRAT